MKAGEEKPWQPWRMSGSRQNHGAFWEVLKAVDPSTGFLFNLLKGSQRTPGGIKNGWIAGLRSQKTLPLLQQWIRHENSEEPNWKVGVERVDGKSDCVDESHWGPVRCGDGSLGRSPSSA